MTEIAVLPAAYNPDDHYPPKGTPETALVILISSENFEVVAFTGRYFHAQINCGGFNGEELGLENVPEEPGWYVFSDGRPWAYASEGYGPPDDVGMGGDWRHAFAEDFRRFDYPVPSGYVDP